MNICHSRFCINDYKIWNDATRTISKFFFLRETHGLNALRVRGIPAPVRCSTRPGVFTALRRGTVAIKRLLWLYNIPTKPDGVCLAADLIISGTGLCFIHVRRCEIKTRTRAINPRLFHFPHLFLLLLLLLVLHLCHPIIPHTNKYIHTYMYIRMYNMYDVLVGVTRTININNLSRAPPPPPPAATELVST